jgi:hypothetical protein
MLHFCTLFNSAYLSRGLVLYDSLLKVCPDFRLYVFAFDDDTYEYLAAQGFEKLIPISLKDFEDESMLRVKKTRTIAEYCWTCTSCTILYVLENFNATHCIYLDADMYFYANPAILWNELPSDKSVLITEHRYTPMYDKSAENGIYCIQFMGFKADKNGLIALKWWRDACIDWCFARLEEGKFGDQKYVDDWTTRFEGIHVLQHLGGGLAPWNIQQYRFQTTDGKIKGFHRLTKAPFEVVFYHYHSVRFFTPDKILLTESNYEIESDIIDLFYKPYIQKLVASAADVKSKSDKIKKPNGDFAPAISRAMVVFDFIKGKGKAFLQLFSIEKKKITNRYLFDIQRFLK